MNLTKEQHKHLDRISKKLKLKLLLLHGSAVTGKTHPNSDLDLAFLTSKVQPVSTLDLLHELYAVFPDQTLDLVDLKIADPLLLQEIANSSHLLFGSQEDHQLFKLHAYHRYNDYLPYFKSEKAQINRYFNSF